MAGHVFAQNMLECLIIKMVTEKVLNLFSFVAMSGASELGIMIRITPRYSTRIQCTELWTLSMFCPSCAFCLTLTLLVICKWFLRGSCVCRRV